MCVTVSHAGLLMGSTGSTAAAAISILDVTRFLAIGHSLL